MPVYESALKAKHEPEASTRSSNPRPTSSDGHAHWVGLLDVMLLLSSCQVTRRSISLVVCRVWATGHAGDPPHVYNVPHSLPPGGMGLRLFLIQCTSARKCMVGDYSISHAVLIGIFIYIAAPYSGRNWGPGRM